MGESYQCHESCSCKVSEKNNDQNSSNKEFCSRCSISTERSIHTRRCFMTGEYCSQKTNIQHERRKLYRGGKDGIVISAFVIMNFSDMSDVVYNWRVEVFVESLVKYLYFDSDNNRLYCSAKSAQVFSDSRYKKVKKINVVRADSDPASNYIICSRICQQIQIADLIIVDVSSQNPNVFYEFGMAVALEKLILPICFSESFYKLELPDYLKKLRFEYKEKTGKEIEDEKGSLYEALHHIGCYPWRKSLYEYYGIRFRQNEKEGENANTWYADFDVVKNEIYGFSDIQYERFPYDEKIDIPNNLGETKKEMIGEVIYKRLKDNYNNATKWNNTLVVYTIEGFLNEDQAGLCIVNFFHSITEKMQKEQCFRGERVGVLVQDHVIPDSDKDAKKERHLLYNVGEIVHIGVNQATYLASKEKVLSEDVFQNFKAETGQDTVISDNRKKYLQRYIKEFIGNRGMIIYPNYPVYVKRIKNQTTPDILKKENIGCYVSDFFCLYHVMLRNLRYTNEIVVDITSNCLQSLFWLGAAHGSEVDAITVKQELSEKERMIAEENVADSSRNVFDVAGLWTAYYYSYNTEGFYYQLALAQFGIEKHSKIIPSDTKWHGLKKWENLRPHETDDEEDENSADNGIENKERETARLESRRRSLESYYRRRFWNAMLRYNRLRIYIPQHDDTDTEDKDPRMRAAKWDMDAVSGLTHYLSKRAVIGEYLVITLPDKITDAMAKEVNFICMGQPVNPLQETLTEHIYNEIQKEGANGQEEHINIIHKHFSDMEVFGKKRIEVQAKGFIRQELTPEENRENKFLKYHPWAGCQICNQNTNHSAEAILKDYPVPGDNCDCPFINNSKHIEVAQLILWREDGITKEERHFRVSLVGSSGPATFGLASLFVDESQKLYDFLDDEGPGVERNNMEYNCNLLYELQSKVRKKIYDLITYKLRERITSMLSEEVKSPEKSAKYTTLVIYTVLSYISTVLYRYFLPFLAEKDIHRIKNGISMFVNSMKAARKSPFCIDYKSGVGINHNNLEISNTKVREIVKAIPDEVIAVLENFKGLEAFYEVEVAHYSRSSERAFADETERDLCTDTDSQSDEQSVVDDEDVSEIVAASLTDNKEDSNCCDDSLKNNTSFCNRKNFNSVNQKDNRKVISMKMMDEINYFMLPISGKK